MKRRVQPRGGVGALRHHRSRNGQSRGLGQPHLRAQRPQKEMEAAIEGPDRRVPSALWGAVVTGDPRSAPPSSPTWSTDLNVPWSAWSNPHSLVAIRDDPTKNRLPECAVAGEASYVVSGNKHLLKLKVYKEMVVPRPAGFVTPLNLAQRRQKGRRPGSSHRQDPRAPGFRRLFR
jgi:hypothetical protein